MNKLTTSSRMTSENILEFYISLMEYATGITFRLIDLTHRTRSLKLHQIYIQDEF